MSVPLDSGSIHHFLATTEDEEARRQVGVWMLGGVCVCVCWRQTKAGLLLLMLCINMQLNLCAGAATNNGHRRRLLVNVQHAAC